MVISYIHRGLGYYSVTKLHINAYYNMLIHINVQKIKTETSLIILAKLCEKKHIKFNESQGVRRGSSHILYNTRAEEEEGRLPLLACQKLSQ